MVLFLEVREALVDGALVFCCCGEAGGGGGVGVGGGGGGAMAISFAGAGLHGSDRSAGVGDVGPAVGGAVGLGDGEFFD